MTFSKRMAVLVIKQRYRENFNPSIMLRQSTHQRQKNDWRWTSIVLIFFPAPFSQGLDFNEVMRQTNNKKSPHAFHKGCVILLSAFLTFPHPKTWLYTALLGRGGMVGGMDPSPGHFLRRGLCLRTGCGVPCAVWAERGEFEVLAGVGESRAW